MVRAHYPAMSEYFPDHIGPYLDERLSHLVFRKPGPELATRVQTLFLEKGLVPVREVMLTPDDREPCYLVSLDLSDTRELVMEIVGLGLGEDVLGIDAKSSAGRNGPKA